MRTSPWPVSLADFLIGKLPGRTGVPSKDGFSPRNRPKWRPGNGRRQGMWDVLRHVCGGGREISPLPGTSLLGLH